MERNLFAKIYSIDGRIVTLGHLTNVLGSYMYNYNKLEATDMSRERFLDMLDKLKKDKVVSNIETWEGLLQGEYINIRTGKVEKLYGF